MSDPESPDVQPRVPRTDQAEASSTGEELPPLPDGGLSTAMPTWLQQAPSRPSPSRAPETVDVSALTAGVEVPEWLQELSQRVDGAVKTVESPPMPAEHVEDAGAPEGERELAATEAAIESEMPATEASSPKARETFSSASTQTSVDEPEPVRSFQVRSGNRAGQSSSQGGSTQGAPLQHAGVGEGLVSSGGQQPSGRASEIRSSRAPAREQPRSLGAVVLLMLLLVALVAVGISYYWL